MALRCGAEWSCATRALDDVQLSWSLWTQGYRPNRSGVAPIPNHIQAREERATILGMSTQVLTLAHVANSLLGIATGLVVGYGLRHGWRLPGWTATFLLTTVLTSITGFFFHSKSFGPLPVVGVVSLAVLAVALNAPYGSGLSGRWRWICVVTGVLALYCNVFVAVVQASQKLPVLHELAAIGQEPAVAITQLIVFAGFAAVGVGAVRRFHPPQLT